MVGNGTGEKREPINIAKVSEENETARSRTVPVMVFAHRCSCNARQLTATHELAECTRPSIRIQAGTGTDSGQYYQRHGIFEFFSCFSAMEAYA